MGVDDSKRPSRLKWFYIATAVVIGLLLLARVFVAVNNPAALASNEGLLVLVDAFVISLVIGFGTLLALSILFRRRIFGGLAALRERFPTAVVFPAMIDETQLAVLKAAAPGPRSFRLPGYFTVVAEKSSFSVWLGRSPEAVALWDATEASFSQGVANTLAQPRAVDVALSVDTQRARLIAVPLAETMRLIPSPLDADAIQELIERLNSIRRP